MPPGSAARCSGGWARKREAAEGAGPEEPEKPEDLLKKAEDSLAGLDLAGAGKRAIGVQGTFNAMAARGLGAGSAVDRTAKATEETAKNTRKLLNEAMHGGLIFS